MASRRLSARGAALLCVGEALKLCLGALKALAHGLACLRAKRRLLSALCGGVYDQGVSFLRGRDVHSDLQALRKIKNMIKENG